MNKLSLLSPVALLATLLMPLNEVLANPWYWNAATSITQGSYANASFRARLSEAGVVVSGDYLEQGGISLGYSKTLINMKYGITGTDQNNFLVSGRLNYWTDVIPGKFTLRVDSHYISNNDTTGNTDGVIAVAPQMSWLSNEGYIYADVGFARSAYQNQLTVNQYTPTLGFGFNDGAEWVQLRGYLISGLNPTRAANLSSTNAADLKVTHFTDTHYAFVPTSLALNVSAGERIYAVDMDAQSVSNLSDIHKGAASLALTWDISREANLLLVGGQSQFQNVALSNNYNLNVAYASLSVDW